MTKASGTEKKSLKEWIASAAQRHQVAASAAVIYLTGHEDGTWSAGTERIPGAAKLVREKDYPVGLFYRRADINGSTVVEADVCKDRQELLDSLNWLGECCLTPTHLWDFDISKIRDRKLLCILDKAGDRRREVERQAAAEFYEAFKDER